MQPALIQALLQMMLGSAGSPSVPVPAAPTPTASPAPTLATAPAAASTSGSTAVPVSALTNVLSTIASQTSEAYNAERARGPSAGPFLYGANPWESAVDLASPESRAGALMNMLRESGNAVAAATLARRQRVQRLKRLAQAFPMADAYRPYL
jgi:hypothetical protein